MLNCQGCGVSNPPYEAACVLCAKPLQDAATAEAKRREWDALPPRLREEQERAFVRMRESVEEHGRWLRRHRLVHAIIGAGLVNMLMNGSVFFASPWSIPVDLALGAASALLLNRLRGGAWNGAGIFAGAAVASMILRAPFLNLGVYLMGYWFLTSFAAFLLVISGYVMGIKLEFDTADRAVTP
ncbi:MAG: hypothetical protein HY293_10960 [Planctomycetes bacterium]|nr:hypothetical protein [Planctomycetota bacterium]